MKSLAKTIDPPRARLALLALLALYGCSAFGSNPSGELLERLQRTPHYGDKGFENPNGETLGFERGDLRDVRRRGRANKARREPALPIALQDASLPVDDTILQDGVRVTWYGHATTLLEIDGFTVLTDPIWSERCSPFQWIGPQRYVPPPVPLQALPELDAVVISHDHYDHLDEATIKALDERGVKFYVPLGVGAHLERWGVTHYEELDWWQHAVVRNDKDELLRLIATPAQHSSGRGAVRDLTLWSSWAIVGPRHRAWFGGDTGLDREAFASIGEHLGPFDLTLVPIGSYDPAWPEVHVNPEEAIAAHELVRGELMIPIHWGTFDLGVHPWDEPIERAVREASARGVALHTPRHGVALQVSEAASPSFTPPEAWWREYTVEEQSD